MTDYSDLIMVIGALVIVMMVSLNANRLILHSTRSSVESEVEYNAIALAQSELDEARWAPFARLDSTHPNYFFNGYPKQAVTSLDTFSVSARVDDVVIPGTNSSHRRITVTVSSPYMPNDIRMSYMKNRSN